MKSKIPPKAIERAVHEVNRNIRRDVERELWARAAGRCQFSGCNRILYKSPMTQDQINLSQKAHIYSFSRIGPRGHGHLNSNTELLNEIGNLLLVCHDCHVEIDKRKDGGHYRADLLIEWKTQHEKRIAIVAGVNPSKKSTVILYGANIGEEKSPLRKSDAHWALFPYRYPSDENPLCLSMTWEGKDDRKDYWQVEEQNLRHAFDRHVRPLIEEGHHFSIFGLAPIPLLVRLGTLFTDKVASDVYQLQREPEQTWQWSTKSHNTDYILKAPTAFKYPPALIISLSATISQERLRPVVGKFASIWEITIAQPGNDFLKTRQQLSAFRYFARQVMVQIAEKHGIHTPLSIFPTMPVAAAIELGRVRMPKAEMPWMIYDHNNRTRAFVKALEIGRELQ